MSLPRGVILYQGRSLLDRSPIVAIATGLTQKTANAKTGDAIQTWILADDGADPAEAHLAGEDYSICGDCAHREANTCYVNLVQAPLAVWKAYQRGRYPFFEGEKHAQLFLDRYVRFGSYGDPAAVPLRVWRTLSWLASTWTGYTHQWRTCDQRLRNYCMASVETIEQAHEAWLMGWRSFRVRLADQPVEEGEFICPASAEAGKRLTCQECKACSGATASFRAVSPTIILHGPQVMRKWQEPAYRRQVALAQGQRLPLTMAA
jgi:hypothetical protein